MLLAIDVGNTNITLALYQGKEIIVSWRLSTDRNRTADEYGILLHNLFASHRLHMNQVEAIVIGSVVPPTMRSLVEMCQRYFHLEALVVGPGVRTGIDIRYENPREVGADRILNAVAGYEKYGGPLIVVDFGTGTTFDVVSADGAYIGGAIAPGIGISTEALFQRAAKLPRIELVRPKTVIGKNTVSAMQAGIIYGFVGQVDGICRRIKKELGGEARVIATGGLAELIAADSEEIDAVDAMLTLDGLRIVYERNQGGR
ncbi:MAG: type III pantothenate kinase [Bacillota bacterium]